jgi:hypothetical protein
MNKQQTAVEWLEIEVKKFNTVITKEYILLLCQQAKEMEKEKLKEAWNKGEDCGLGRSNYEFENADDYYNETYGGNK